MLRQFTDDDADHLWELDSDPEVMRYIGPFRLADPEAYRQHIRKTYFAYYARSADYGVWAAVEKARSQFIGWFCLRPGLDYRFAAEAQFREGDIELGYRLRRAAWGQGYATEGARALVRETFTEAGTSRVVATTMVTNLASRRVLEKAGLKREEEFAMPGFDTPAVKYALSREQYERAFRAHHDTGERET